MEHQNSSITPGYTPGNGYIPTDISTDHPSGLANLPKELVCKIGQCLDVNSVKSLREADLRVTPEGTRSSLRDPTVTQHLAARLPHHAISRWLSAGDHEDKASEAFEWCKRSKLGLPPEINGAQLLTMIESGILNTVEELNLTGCRELTQAVLIQLSRLPNIKSLNVADCDLVGDDLGFLASLPSLESLNLSANRTLADHHFRQIPRLPKLRSLDLSRCQIRGEGLRFLPTACPAIENLNLGECDELRCNTLANVTRLPLKSLSLAGCYHLNFSAFPHIAQMHQLVTLDLTRNDIVGDFFGRLSRLGNLEELTLKYSERLNDQGLAYLAELPQLRVLSIEHCSRITDQGLDHLSRVTTLKELHVMSCDGLTPQGIERLRGTNTELVVNEHR